MAGNSNSPNLPERREYGRLDAKSLSRIVNRAELARATKPLEEKLRAFGMQGFSDPAATALSESMTLHVRQVGEDAISLAKRDRLDAVSEDHIKRAASRLRRADAPAWKTVLNIIGGALVGTAIQEVIGIMNSDAPLGKQRVLITMALLVAGILAVCFAVVPRRTQ